MKEIVKRAWAEIDLRALEHNYIEIRSKLPKGCRFLGVVKADAYSHGAKTISRELERLGADYLAVACLDEAIALRVAGIEAPILMFGAVLPSYARKLVKYDITQTVCSLEMAQKLSAELHGDALKVHYKIDTGMGRLGFGPDEAVGAITRALELPNLISEGIYTHFAVSDEVHEPFTLNQFEIFIDAVGRIESLSSHHFSIKHCANSGAVINYPQTYLDMVRPGLALYGHYPGPERGDLNLKPVLQFKARVSAIHEHIPGDTISYGRKYTVEKPMKTAVVAVGYADGLHRTLSGKIEMLINGQRVKQIGRICMDMCMVDVSDVPCDVGDVVTIFGVDGDQEVSVEELSELAGTISYELLCALSRRVPRVYFK